MAVVSPAEFLEQLGVSYTEPTPRAVPKKDMKRRLVLDGPFNGRSVDCPESLEIFEIGRLTGYYKRVKDHFEYRTIVNFPHHEKPCPWK